MKVTRKQWLIIAEAFGTPYKEQTNLQKAISNDGLCNAMRIAHPSGRFTIIDSLRRAMDIPTHCEYWLFDPIFSDEQRCLFACLMAAIEPREIRRMIEGAK